MRQYRGYFIDHVIFNSAEEIDIFINNKAIERYKKLIKMFAEDPCMELIKMQGEVEDRLAEFLSWEEIEAIEIEALKEIA